jgi:hypothetical protein
MLNVTPKLTPFKLFTLWRTATYLKKLCIYGQNHINLRFGVVQLQQNIKISLNFDNKKLNRKMCCIYNIKNNDGEITYFRKHYSTHADVLNQENYSCPKTITVVSHMFVD